MIKPEEIRVSNLVKSNLTGDIVLVDWLVIKHIQDNGNIQSVYDNRHVYEPIPLTEELLVKAGFKKETNEYFLIKHEYSNLLIFYSKIHNRFWYFADVERRQYNSTKPIEYLHQLQNLYFALTGTELTIKL